MADRVGQRLGNYRLVRLLGRGGFAEVYLGQHVRLNMQAAIKVLHTQLADEDVENFHREAETIAALIHPHIVRLLDFDVKDDIPFLIMDYAPNGSLRQLYPKGTPLPLSTIVSYTRQIAAALQYAHDKKIIHRDVKPENMLLGRSNEVLLSDFGIAMMTQSSRYQATQETVGTIYYMAPEQLQGKPRLASDQYALGVVIYEWLSGERPFNGSFTEIVAQHLAVPAPPLYGKVPVVSLDVERVVMTTLAKDPQQRFPSVQACATALAQACQRALSRPVALPTEVPLLTEPSPLTRTGAAIPLSQSLPSTNVATPPHTPDVLPSSLRGSVPPGESQSSKYRLPQRLVLWVLAALLLLGGGLTWLTLSHAPFGSAVNRALTTTSPTAFTPLSTPSPTAPPVIVPQPTLTTDCGHLVTPWVALYQYSNYGGRELCFEGKGLINLADFGFDKQTNSINIAANGVFFDQPNGKGAQLGFYYGDEKADLRNWDSRISSFRVDS
jgi:serine/threonine protein kinase